ncbi:MAG: hypothetical protein IKJ39_02855 [Lachnospiraceae bacterium]|nr:hypothetical protein [Lachnospiraceae bacterium]
MDVYHIIKSKISKNDYEFDNHLLLQLSAKEFAEINEHLAMQVYKGNASCYKFIKNLKGIYLAQLMSMGHKKTLSEDNWIRLVTNIYFTYPKPSLLENIVEMARTNRTALEQLKVIAQENPQIIELEDIIQDIENHQQNKPESSDNLHNIEFEYYKLSFGAIVKVQKSRYLLYRLDTNTRKWIEDHEMFIEMANGSYAYEPICIIDNYPYEDDTIGQENDRVILEESE